MLAQRVLVALWMASVVTAYNVTTATRDNYTEITQGKSVFVRFFAPWCGHSSKMENDWQALANDWVNDPDGLIVDVDCTAGYSFCRKHRVDDYPTLKYGDPNALEDYQGPRSYSILAEFAKEFLKPCSPSRLDTCTPDQKQLLEHYPTLTPPELEVRVQEEKGKVKQLKRDFAEQVEKLEKDYQKMVQAKAQRVKEIEQGDLRYMLAIQKARAKGIMGPANRVDASDKEEL